MLDIDTIKDRGLCSGCGLCAGIGASDDPAIVMQESSEGFRRPTKLKSIDADHARLIDATCPGVNIRHDPSEFDAPYHSNWGPLAAARLGWSSDPELRQNASSGGGLSAILNHLLDSGEIDYVVQTVVSPGSPIRNAVTISSKSDEVFRAAGSRYAPSSPLEDIGARLDAPGRFAFVGKPCDVAALRQLARHDTRVDDKVAFMLAFMCGGVPSYRGTTQLLREMGVDNEDDVTAFRYRGDGWPGYATAELNDGRRLQMDYDTSWGRILNRHLQFRCKICPDGIGEFADITCADGWHLDDNDQPMFDERDGRTIILTRTQKGEALVRRAVEGGSLVAQSIEPDEIRKMQPYQAKRKGLVATRLAAMAVAGRARPNYANLLLIQNLKSLPVKEGLKSFLGTLRRLVTSQKAQN